jgi:hypothetical protein
MCWPWEHRVLQNVHSGLVMAGRICARLGDLRCCRNHMKWETAMQCRVVEDYHRKYVTARLGLGSRSLKDFRSTQYITGSCILQCSSI